MSYKLQSDVRYVEHNIMQWPCVRMSVRHKSAE